MPYRYLPGNKDDWKLDKEYILDYGSIQAPTFYYIQNKQQQLTQKFLCIPI